MKRFIGGFVAGAVLFGATSAFATTGGNMIEVFYNIKDIKINKVSNMPTDENKPFVFNGSTYVPLRFVADALGQHVKWDSETQTVLIGETGKDDSYYLGDTVKSLGTVIVGRNGGMNSIYDGSLSEKAQASNEIANDGSDNVGKKFGNYVTLITAGEISTSYPLSGEYKRFKTHLAIPNLYKNMENAAELQILLNDKPLTTTYKFKSGDLPQDIDIDVSGVNKITFKLNYSRISTDNWVELALFDARLTK